MDEHHGMGGSYIRDPNTGQRTLVHRTEEKKRPSQQATAETATPAADASKARKGRPAAADVEPFPASTETEGSERQ